MMDDICKVCKLKVCAYGLVNPGWYHVDTGAAQGFVFRPHYAEQDPTRAEEIRLAELGESV